MTPARRGQPPHSGSVRIIGGRWRGTRLPVADAVGLRPTSDRSRETLFNWLNPMLAGTRVLDLFAGSGVLGLEALSRGAREVLLVEREPRLAQSLVDMVDKLDAQDQAHVVRADALAFLRAPLHGRFGLVFLDPPFDAELWQSVLDGLDPWVTDDAWLYIESPPGSVVHVPSPWVLHRDGATRDARHALYRRSLPTGHS